MTYKSFIIEKDETLSTNLYYIRKANGETLYTENGINYTIESIEAQDENEVIEYINNKYMEEKDMTNFNTLPAKVQDDIKSALRAYDKAYVVYEYGEYHVSVGISLKAQYAPDHKFIGVFKATEIYSEDERMLNYIEEFHEYPHNYNGKRDYRMLHDIEGKWDIKFKFDNERNLVIA